MSEITSSIRIEDGFTEPLKNLAKASWDVESAVTSVAKGLVDQQDYLKEVALEAKDAGIAFGTSLYGGIQSSAEAAKSFSQTWKNNLSDFQGVESVKELAIAFKDLSVSIGESAAEGAMAYRRFADAIATIKKLPLNLVNKVSMSAFHKMKDSYIKGFNALMSSLEKSMDEINVTDKLNAMWGEAGDVARKRAYELANELGESATMVSNLAANAAYEGIGTQDFERMMKLADKVSKLKPGESTENVANSLIQNIKSGHDASSVAQMFGGGQQMERQLRRSGYERALNKGDVEGALKIAEKIAEQAGLTDEKYKLATNNLSQNYKKIQNTIDNVQRQLAETFNRTFAPTVQKIRELLESDKFKTFVKIANYLIGKLGQFLNWFTETAVDNIHVIGVLLGVGIVTKIMLIVPKIALIFKMLALSKGPLGFALRTLGGIVGKLVTIVAKQGALAAMKVAGPWIAAGAAVAGITYGVYKLTGTTKSFTGWLKGVLAAAFTGAKNVFTNVFIFFDRIADYIKALPELFKAASEDIANELSHSINKALGKKKIKYEMVSKEELAKMSDEEKKGLVQNGYGYTFRKIELSDEYISKTDEILNKIHENQMKYIDVTQGMEEAYETEGASTVEWLKKLFKQGEEQTKDQKGIKTDTDRLRQLSEQEEELRWLKAFSDRQIMSAYNSQTTNNRTINLNGVSQNTMAEAYRRNRSTIPARAAM